MIVYCALFQTNLYIGLRKQWRKYDNLAQVSGARLSESIRKPSQVLRELSLRRRAPVLSEKPSRSSEEVSPEQENVAVPLFLFRALAQAKRACLSEAFQPQRELGENVPRSCFLLCSQMFVTCLTKFIMFKHGMSDFCMYWMVYGLALMSMA